MLNINFQPDIDFILIKARSPGYTAKPLFPNGNIPLFLKNRTEECKLQFQSRYNEYLKKHDLDSLQ